MISQVSKSRPGAPTIGTRTSGQRPSGKSRSEETLFPLRKQGSGAPRRGHLSEVVVAGIGAGPESATSMPYRSSIFASFSSPPSFPSEISSLAADNAHDSFRMQWIPLSGRQCAYGSTQRLSNYVSSRSVPSPNMECVPRSPSLPASFLPSELLSWFHKSQDPGATTTPPRASRSPRPALTWRPLQRIPQAAGVGIWTTEQRRVWTFGRGRSRYAVPLRMGHRSLWGVIIPLLSRPVWKRDLSLR